MIDNTELQALRDYVVMLERENQAKVIERDTIYRELDALQTQLKQIDVLYQTNKHLKGQVRKLNEINQHQVIKFLELNQLYLELSRQKNEVQNMNQQNQMFSYKIENLQRSCECLRVENLKLQNEIKVVLKQMNHYRFQNKSLNQQNQIIRSSIQSLEKERSKSLTIQRQKQLYQRKLEELANNYYRIEAILIEKQNQNSQLSYQLSQIFHQLEKQGQENEAIKQILSQRDIMIDCLESQLEQLKATLATFRRTGQEEANEIENLSKMDLIRQANILVQRVNFLQKENRGYNYSPNQFSKTLVQLQEMQMQYQNLMQTLSL